MRVQLISISIFLFWSCSTSKKEIIEAFIKQKGFVVDSLGVHPDDSVKVNITVNEKDTVFYTKAELKKILQINPELNDGYPEKPEVAYAKWQWHAASEANEEDRHRFVSECGQDEYFILYAYFLKQKNGDKEFNTQRKKLTAIYETINGIFWGVRGGTFFSHQYSRIVGYVEYSIYNQKDNDFYIKAYDYKKQKQLYINSLTQLIKDEISVADFIVTEEKPAKQKELLKSVTALDNLITNYAELKCAQEFQFTNY